MRLILISIFIVLAITTARSQTLIGAGLGFDWVEGYDTSPLYTDKDLNINFSQSWKYLVVEGRQGFRYMEGFEKMRYNTYALIGFTTLKEKFFVFDFLGGVAASFVDNHYSQKHYYYLNQLCPTIKTSMSFRLSKKNRLYLGIDFLLSTYKYVSGTDKFGGNYETVGLTGSAIASINYRFLKKSEKEK